MRTIRHNFFFCTVILGLSAASSDASIVIDNWNLVTGVAYTNGGDSHISTIVQNPFVGAYSAFGPGPSWAQTTYDLSWTTENAVFAIQGTHQAVGADPSLMQVATEGGFFFTTTADLILTVDASYNYNLAGPSLYSELGLGVQVVEGEQWPVIFTTNRVAHTFVGYPAIGTHSISEQILLDAGHQYLFGYGMQMLAFNNTGATGTGDGYVHFTLSPVPEPATILPLALGALMLRRRR